MHPFRSAVEAQNIEAAIALLAEDVVFRSPVVFKPYHGREAVAPLLQAVSRVFEDFRYGARSARRAPATTPSFSARESVSASSTGATSCTRVRTG